jgi:hypothetical protein
MPRRSSWPTHRPRLPTACLPEIALVLLLGGCSVHARSVPTGFELSAASNTGVAIGRLDAGAAVRNGVEPKGDPSLRQEVVHLETGRAYLLPFAGNGLAQDFEVVLPAGRYQLDDGRADSGTRGTGLSVGSWWDTGVEFEVRAGGVTCVGKLVVSSRQHFLGAILSLGRGASISWVVQDECEGIISRFGADHPELGEPTTALASGG